MSVAESDQKTLYSRIRPQYEALFTLKDTESGQNIWPVFNVLPTKKDYPDYYAVIKHPISFNTLKKRVPHYTDPQLFLVDVARISWNAKTYNTKGSVIYAYANILEEFVKTKIFPALKEYFPQIKYPYFGPLPDEVNDGTKDLSEFLVVTDDFNKRFGRVNERSMEKSLSLGIGGGDNDIEDEYRDSGRKMRSTRSKLTFRGDSPSISSQRGASRSYTPQPGYKNNNNIKTHVRRGRPPVIDLPYIQRMKNVLKVLKREVNLSSFERLPDENERPEYYTIIPTPVSLDMIKKKVKTRKYKDFNNFRTDFELMLANYKLAHRAEPQAIKLVTILEKKFNTYAHHEESKPDEDYMPEGELRYPLDEAIVNGTKYVIGDWCLLNNPNDATKPTVGQIFRIWSTSDGRKWLNACWYIRPEQTVHRVDRIFYKNEVFKTGQYRDHLLEEIVGKCYVVHFTRFQRGDPDININGPLFVCEFRYNENDKGFNKIRTWKACLPEEIRDQEEVTIPVNGRKFFKYPSPLKHLLPPDATVNDPIPQPTNGAVNAPPLIGAVYLRPKLARDDLGEYSTSDDCPRYIIRPGDPPGEGKIDYETGTIVSSGASVSSFRPSWKNSRQSPNLSGTQSPSVGEGILNNNSSKVIRGTQGLTIQGLKQHQLNKQLQQQQLQLQHKQSQASKYNMTNIVNNITSRASKTSLGQTLVDAPGAYVLPISITKNIDMLQRSDFGNQIRRLSPEEIMSRKRSRGEALWFKGSSITVTEKMINFGDEHLELPLNRWFSSNKRPKYDYEEVEEKLDHQNQNEPIDNTTGEDIDNETETLPGSFLLGLRPSARFMAYELSSQNIV